MNVTYLTTSNINLDKKFHLNSRPNWDVIEKDSCSKILVIFEIPCHQRYHTEAVDA